MNGVRLTARGKWLLLAVLVVLIVLVPDDPVTPRKTSPGAPVDRLPACVYDDGTLPHGATACYWDADEQGNGEGRSFTHKINPDGTDMFVYDPVR